MLNLKIISKILGFLLFIEAALFCVCLGLSFYFHEADKQAFFISALAAAGLGLGLCLYGRGAENHMSRRDSYLIISLSWLAFSLVGMLPYLISGSLPSVHDAFFETVSGFTTTGATVIDRLDSLPHGLRFWRCLSQWIGGLGIVLFTMALLPMVVTGETKLFAVEATGPQKQRLHPHIKNTVIGLWSVYVLLTVACAVVLWLCGMNLFDSLGHALGTASTGGFSTRQSGIMGFGSASIEYAETLFMFLSGVNFTLLYALLFRRKAKMLLCDTEFRSYCFLVLLAVVLVAGILVLHGGWTAGQSVRAALFQVVSMQTTTGYCQGDFMAWPAATWPVLGLVMVVGACAGSTSGGIKTIRLVMLFRLMANEFRHMLHPRAVLPLRINHQPINNDLVRTLTAFLGAYLMLTVAASFLFTLMGVDFWDAMSISISSLSNVGPCVGPSFGGLHTWSALPDAGKWLSSFLMIVGRLEVFALLLLLLPDFWKEN